MIGTFALSDLESGRVRLSPFNVTNTLDTPFFTLAEERELFGQFVAEQRKRDASFTIDERIIEYVYTQTAGVVSFLFLIFLFLFF